MSETVIDVAEGEWHLEITLVSATLRRYSGKDAAKAYEEKIPFDVVASADIRKENAYLRAMLVSGKPLTREDRRIIERLLRRAGATTFTAERHDKVKQLTPDT